MPYLEVWKTSWFVGLEWMLKFKRAKSREARHSTPTRETPLNIPTMPSRNIAPKQASAKSLRAKRKREPQVNENPKKALVIRGRKISQDVSDALTDVFRLKSPDAMMFSRKNDINPMEDETSAEFLMAKNDCSLIAFGSHNKKRPNNLVLGRTFDGHVLDMIELGLVSFSGSSQLRGMAKRVGSKPAMMFMGDRWGRSEEYRKLQNLLIDFFRGEVVGQIALAGLDHCMVCTTVGDNVLLRHYHIGFKRSGSKVPSVLLTDTGPSMDLVVRRTSFAAKDLWKAAVKKPRVSEPKKVKNVSSNSMGDKMGRIHLGRQDLSSMKVRRVKALRTTGSSKRAPEDGENGETMGEEGIAKDIQREGEGEGGASAASIAKRGTRRKNKERKLTQ
ncbi:unnamed protein product [Choristocarpus tenellus]